tara:strand:- start:1022 stop:1261 length:240 start_codon:yes stop_codon:yes gene_type:complete
MSSWIQTKAGLQMAETIIRNIPRLLIVLKDIRDSLSHISLNSNFATHRESIDKIGEELEKFVSLERLKFTRKTGIKFDK